MRAPPSEDAARESAAPFVWPPGRDAERSRARAFDGEQLSAAPASGALSRLRDLASRLECALLPCASTPLSSRIASGVIVFDPPEAYCDRCGGDIGPHESEEVGCAACAGRRLPWARFVRLGVYEGGLAQAVQEVKFRRFRALGVALGRELGRALIRAGAEREQPAIVPIPTSPGRRLKLGVDHTLALARGVAASLDAPIVRALGRRAGPTQLDVPPSERRANVAGVFRPRPIAARRLAGRTAILVDDVRTSGATLRAAARTLGSAEGVAVDRIWSAVAAVAGGS